MADPHEFLARLVGEWRGMTRTWFEKDKLADTQPQNGTMRLVGKGRFILHEYETRLIDHECHGVVLYGYSTQKEQFEAAWVDNCHNDTNIMNLTGRAMGTPFSATGSYTVPDGDPWHWRMEIEMPDGDHVVLTAYNISPAGEEALAVKTEYNRVS